MKQPLWLQGGEVFFYKGAFFIREESEELENTHTHTHTETHTHTTHTDTHTHTYINTAG